jgi:F0F1-type ATP synthase assembly protein I
MHVKEITMTTPSEPENHKSDDNAQNQDQKELKDGDKPAGWIDNLARRSTGLEGDVTPLHGARPKSESNLWRLAGLGVQFAATVAIFAFMGNAIDKRMGWSPWTLVAFSLLAIIGNLYLLIKETLKQDTPAKKPPK